MTPMNICFDVPSCEASTAVALGTFDGVHLGHRQVLDQMRQAAVDAELQRWVYTFKNHPKTVVRPHAAPLLLSTWEEKVSLLRRSGELEGVVLQTFDEDFSQQSPEQFVKEVLCERMRVKHLAVGYNFRFGHQARGDGALLQRMGQELGFTVTVVPAYTQQDQEVSSSRIRGLLMDGELETALPLLGGTYLVAGTVIHGQGIAAKFLGVPTANLEIDPETKALPPRGVYACDVRIEGQSPTYHGVLNLGLRPTFSGEGLSLEVFLLDFEGDLYGKQLEVFFSSFVRPEQKFDGPEALKAQIHRDIAQVRKLLG